MTKRDNVRKNYFIEKKFQSKFILQFCILAVLGLAVSAAALFIYLQSKGTVTTAFVNSRLSIITTADYILPIVIAVSIVTMILISIATAITVMYLSHRIAGPLFNISRSLKTIGEGDLSLKIKLRSTDEIKRMAEAINAATEGIRTKFLDVKIKAQDLSAEVESLAKQGEKGGVSNLLKKKEELNNAIDKFKVE